MLPATATSHDRSTVEQSARRLTSSGYVYIASPEEKTMEDREEIRYMPLHLEMLPCFGSITAVCVVRDESLADAARAAYPGTEVLVIDPAATLTAGDEATAEMPASQWTVGTTISGEELAQAA